MSDSFESTGRRPPGQWRDQPMRGSSGAGNQWSESGEQTWRRPKCYHCGRLGHRTDQCYQKQSYGDYGGRGSGGHKWRSGGAQYGRRSGPKKQWSDRRSSKSASADGVSAEVNHFPQLSDFYLNRRLSDVTFVCDGQSLFAHKFVVSAKSQVFKEMLFQSTAECDSKTDNDSVANPETKASEEMVTESQSTAGEEKTDESQSKSGEELVVDSESKVDKEMTTECQPTVGEEIAVKSESKIGEELAVDSESKVDEEMTTECQPTEGEEIAVEGESQTGEELAVDNESKVGEEIAVDNESKTSEELAANNVSNTGDQMVVDNQSKTGEDAVVDMELKSDEEMADKSQLKTNEELDVDIQSKPIEEMVTECQSAVGEEITDGSDSKAAENDESKKGEDAAIDVVKTCPEIDLIHISDTNVEAFKLLLKFLYTEEFADEMSADPVMADELLKLAIRFKVDPLATFLQSKTTE